MRKISQLALEKAAQAWCADDQSWCADETNHITMIPVLYFEFAKILDEIWSKPWLGNATNGELLNEIKARIDLNYKTTGEAAL